MFQYDSNFQETLLQTTEKLVSINQGESHCYCYFEGKREIYFKRVQLHKLITESALTRENIEEKIYSIQLQQNQSNDQDLRHVLKYSQIMASGTSIYLLHEPIIKQKSLKCSSVKSLALGSLSYKKKLRMMINISKAIKDFHDQNKCLRTLQSATIVILKNESEETSFCFSQIRNLSTLNQKRAIEQICKCKKFFNQEWNYQTAPEIVRRKKHDLSADIWSLGAIFYEIFTSKPFPIGLNQKAQNIFFEEYHFIEDESFNWMKSLITKMTSFDPSDRQKIKDVLSLLKNAEVCSGISTYF